MVECESAQPGTQARVTRFVAVLQRIGAPYGVIGLPRRS
jgi:hypothetical protein